MNIKYKISAVIPSMQYGNLQPSIELEGEDIKEMEAIGLGHIKDMFNRFSETPLKEKGGTKTFYCVKESITSFNEDVEIDFDRKGHAYFYKGNALEGATAFVGRYTKTFDSKAVAKNCEKSWGVPAPKIEKMWKSNGNVSSEFGSLIHNALEHYNNHKEQGKIIMEKSGKDINPAIPKHPIIRDIILGFEELVKGEKGEVFSEILVSDVKGGRCGQIDRLLVTGDKTCRVQDYKINIGSKDKGQKLLEPYNNLPPTKMSKYQLQLSYYADVLKKSGWKVEGIDVFVYEDKWIHEVLDILEV